MKPPRFLPMILAGLTLSWADSASTYKPGVLRELVSTIETTAPVSVPAAGSIEVGFSPKDGAEALVLHVVDSIKTDIRALSYGFISLHVAATLPRAARHGVAVSLMADYKNNITDDRNGKGRTALSALAEAGCDIRVISAYPVRHDKVLIVDRQTVGLGSFNCSSAAARVNPENILVNWNSPAPVKTYLIHFDRNRRQSEPFRVRY